jgi:EmrB/QacA subfamily drug resistance transporter
MFNTDDVQGASISGALGAPAEAVARRWLVAIVMVGAVLMDMIDLTVVNVALPTIRADLHASADQIEWVISAYMLGFAAVLIVAGSFGDTLGRRRVFVSGIAVFGLASLAAGVAQSPGELIAARVVQGLAAAAMIPQLLATFRVIFPREDRGKAFGMYGAILGLASALGLVLGGVLTNADLFGWGWRTIFLINVPIAVLAFVSCARLVPETREPSALRPDMVGATLLSATLVAVVYPLLEGRSLGWPGWIWLVLAAGLAGLAALAWVEARRQHGRVAPLMQPQLFRIPAFRAGLVVQLLFALGVQGFFLILALWIQAGIGFSPLRAGLTALGFSAGSFLLAPVAVPFAERYGRLVLASGGVLLAAGFGAVALGAPHLTSGRSAPWAVIPGLVVAGAGLALLVIPLVNVVLAATPREAAGAASGQFTTAQQLGGALGVAIVGSLYFAQLESHAATIAFRHATLLVGGVFLAASAVALTLPRTALSGDELY